MSKKLTKPEVIERLTTRNNQNPTNPVYLYPPSQPYQGQTSSLVFRCKSNHVWTSNASRTIFAGAGCPECKKISENNNKRIPFSELLLQFNKVHDNQYTYNESTYINSVTPMTAVCSKHGTFSITPTQHKIGKGGCKHCKKEQSFINKASKKHHSHYDYSSINFKTDNTSNIVEIICPVHGTFSQRASDHLRGHGCKQCSSQGISAKQIAWMEFLMKENNIFIQHGLNLGEYSIPKTRYTVDGYCKSTNTIYEFNGDAFHGNPQKYKPTDYCHPFNKNITADELYNYTKTKECILIDKGYNVISIWESEFDNMNIDVPPIKQLTSINRPRKMHTLPSQKLDTLKLTLIDKEFKGFKHDHNYRCRICGNHINTTLTRRLWLYRKYKTTGCSSCTNPTASLKLLTHLLNQHNISFSQIGDIVIIGNVGIYVQPLLKNDRSFLVKLQEEWRNKEIDLKIIFQDEILEAEDRVVSKLLHYANMNVNQRIHARQCRIDKIPAKEKGIFLDKFHIQGNDNSKVNYGAFFDDNLVAVMTFTKPRIMHGYSNKDQLNGTWELSRFATNTDYRIPGIASKLLTHFQRNNFWKKITSYADRRWSIGNLYDTLGFNLTATNPPSYHYVIDGQRKHRWNYRKDMLKHTLSDYDSKLTEYQNMENAGFWRVWDCGTLRYEILQEYITNA